MQSCFFICLFLVNVASERMQLWVIFIMRAVPVLYILRSSEQHFQRTFAWCHKDFFVMHSEGPALDQARRWPLPFSKWNNLSAWQHNFWLYTPVQDIPNCIYYTIFNSCNSCSNIKIYFDQFTNSNSRSSLFSWFLHWWWVVWFSGVHLGYFEDKKCPQIQKFT